MHNDGVISWHSANSTLAGHKFSFLLPLGSVPDTSIDCNILMVPFLVRIDNVSSQLLLIYDLCPHHTMKSIFPNTTNVICTRNVKQ